MLYFSSINAFFTKWCHQIWGKQVNKNFLILGLYQIKWNNRWKPLSTIEIFSDNTTDETETPLYRNSVKYRSNQCRKHGNSTKNDSFLLPKSPVWVIFLPNSFHIERNNVSYLTYLQYLSYRRHSQSWPLPNNTKYLNKVCTQLTAISTDTEQFETASEVKCRMNAINKTVNK